MRNNCTDPIEILLNSPRSKEAMSNLGFLKDDLLYVSKEELKAKLGDLKLSKQVLNDKFEVYEKERKDKISAVLDVTPSIIYKCLSGA